MTSSQPPADGDLFGVLSRARAAAAAHRKAALQLPPPLRVHDSIEGRGQVYVGEQLLVEGDYWLRDVEEVDKTVFPTGHHESGEPSDARTGTRGVYGRLRADARTNVLGAYVGTPLTLRLQDGRTLEFTVTKVLTGDDALYPHYLVQGVAVPG